MNLKYILMSGSEWEIPNSNVGKTSNVECKKNFNIDQATLEHQTFSHVYTELFMNSLEIQDIS